MTHHTHPQNTNRRRARCIECKAQLAPREGRQVAGHNYLCEACAGLRDEQELAYRYVEQAMAYVEPATQWLLRNDLNRKVLHLGRTCAMIMQAVADRAEMAGRIDYHQAHEYLREECALLGMEA